MITLSINAQPTDTITTSNGNLIIHFIGHGSLFFEHNGMVIHVDPYSSLTDYSKLLKADFILVTHQHGDHLDSAALASIYKWGTTIYWTKECQKSNKLNFPSNVVGNGDKFVLNGINVDVVPAYNIVNKRQNGTPFHSKGEGNGYIFTFGNLRVYVAGDTENIPEMSSFGIVDIAFLPMNLPYTMTPEMVFEAVRMINPKILYPYHFGKTDTAIIVELLKDNPQIEVRIRRME